MPASSLPVVCCRHRGRRPAKVGAARDAEVAELDDVVAREEHVCLLYTSDAADE